MPPTNLTILTVQSQVLLRHRKLLNAYIRQSPTLLDNAFKLIRDSYPRMLDFDNKRVYFNNRLRRENKDLRRGQVRPIMPCHCLRPDVCTLQPALSSHGL